MHSICNMPGDGSRQPRQHSLPQSRQAVQGPTEAGGQTGLGRAAPDRCGTGRRGRAWDRHCMNPFRRSSRTLSSQWGSSRRDRGVGLGLRTFWLGDRGVGWGLECSKTWYGSGYR